MKSTKTDLNKFFFWVNVGIIILSIPLFIFAGLFHVNILKYSNPVPYSEHAKITLKDFKGFKFPGQTLHGMQEFAFIKPDIDYYTRGNSVVIESYFHPSRSYVYNENLEDKDLLKHEICHFSITEYWAREFKRRVAAFKSMPTGSELDGIYEEIKMLEMRMQMEYDDKSYHGYVLKEQQDWENKVDSLLSSLDKFKFKEVVFK